MPYICHRTQRAPALSGRADCDVWRRAPRSPRFVDMVSGEPGWFDTRAAALWDDENLYVAFWIEEPFVEAHQDRRDSLVFLENDVEVFIDGGDCYYEFEINALGTVYEVFFVWQDAQGRGSRFDVPEFDPLAPGALTFGGDYDRTGEHFWRGTHPRGLRRAFLNWDLAGLRSAVHVDGKLNDRMNVDKGWTMEVAFPWAGMRHLAGGRALPPNPGDQWKLFFGRFERLLAGGREIQPHPAWCWTPHGIYDTHRPEHWTPVEFSSLDVSDLPA